MRYCGWNAAALPLFHLNLLAIFLQIPHLTSALDAQDGEASSWYDWGYYGAFPHTNYESFGAQSPKPNLLQTDDRCDDGYIFVEPRGHYVETPGPVMLDNDGHLVWMQTLWGQAMDVKVQQFQGKDYITFWHGSDNGTFGEGYYLMLDEHYEVFKTVTPVGDFSGDLHEFRITDEGTALMTIYSVTAADMSSYGIPNGWIYDSIFQEVDLATDKLLFEWRSSDHYDIDESLAPLDGDGRTPGTAFDYFHINSVDKDADGNYLISSRYMCAVAAISWVDGEVLWQLGGENNDFEDLSDGAATNFTWNHHASWYENTTLTLFDNGSNGHQNTADFSRGLMISLNLKEMTATVVHSYVAPQSFLSPSQGSVQVLPNSNVLVGWGHVPAFTEYTMDGEVLCDTHIGPVNFDLFGWAKNYRTFKYQWVGKPNTVPDVAMRPRQKALFVSWNGATEVVNWVLQSGPEAQGDGFRDHQTVVKTSFETKLDVPDAAGAYVRAVAFDINDQVLGISDAVLRIEDTETEPLEAPERGIPPEPFHIFLICLGTAIGIMASYCYRYKLRRGITSILRRNTFQYQSIPTRS